ncbi:MAG: hypothetical protein ABI939_04715, partial [Anaerolineaceae bacterium]
MTSVPPTLERDQRSGFVSEALGRVSDHPLVTIILVALLARVALMPLWAHLPNGLTDEGFWKHWMEHIHSGGLLNIFRT